MRSKLVIALAAIALVVGSEASFASGGFTVTSPAFGSSADIPVAHTCDGANASPPLEWSGAPAGTKSFALVVEDPDAPVGTWVHWVLYELPASRGRLEQGVPARPDLPDGVRQGTNDFRKPGYGGPCPPHGPAHRYFFRLYALDRKPELTSGATRAELTKAMSGHVLGEAELVGRYGRR